MRTDPQGSRPGAPAIDPGPGRSALPRVPPASAFMPALMPALMPARSPVQRPPDARLLVIDAEGRFTHARRSQWVDLLRPGDLVVANDAATLPASLAAVHAASRRAVELRLAGHAPHGPRGEPRFAVVVFGAGDWRTRTERRAWPPRLVPGDRFEIGDRTAVVEALLDHPRLARVRFEMGEAAFWSLLARHGRPIQYAHLDVALALWDVWTPVASHPAAFEPPSAGFVLDWRSMETLRKRRIGFASLTLAAGVSSTGDPELDARLPLPEPYAIPRATAQAIERVRAGAGRVIAIGTTAVRALEHAASRDGRVHAGHGIADQRIGAGTTLLIADAILTGTHEPGSSHHDLLRAFVAADVLTTAGATLAEHGYRTHEFGDSLLVERRVAATG